MPDLEQALGFYSGRLGLGGIGQLVRPDDETGFLITNLRAGPATLEVFSFDVTTVGRGDAGEPDGLGLRAIGVAGVDHGQTGPGDVPLRRVSAG